MVSIVVQNPDEFKGNVQKFMQSIVDRIEDKVLLELAEKTVTTITSSIDRQRSIDGGILKQNSPQTVAKKQAAKTVVGVPLKIGKGAKASFGGTRIVRSLVDRGLLRKPSTYEIKRLSPKRYEVSVRPIKTADPEDTVTRDKVAEYVQQHGYNFYGISRVIIENVPKIIENAIRGIQA